MMEEVSLNKYVECVGKAFGFASELIYNISMGNVWYAFKTVRKYAAK